MTLRTSEDPELYRRAAEEEAPLDVWMAVIQEHPEMRTWVAHNRTVPIAILEVLARDRDAAVRWVVASKGRITPELLLLLAGDPDETVRIRVARNKRATSEVLHRLAHDESSVVREAAGHALSR